MDSDINEFIRQEQVKLSNIQSGLSAQQRAKLLPKIGEIRFLLGLLAKTGTVISDKDKKDLEKDISKATDDASKTAKAEQIREASNVSLINRVRPNTNEIPELVKQKAKMVRASGLFDSNGGDKQSVNEYLEENDIPYRVSDKVESTGEALVLENINDPTDVKVAFRGSKMNNLQDWISNAKLLAGQEQTQFAGEKDTIGEARAKVQEVETAYGKKAGELLGHSRGASLAMNVGDAEGIDTTTFNAFIGRNLARASESQAQHTAWRTTEDVPSIGLGFRQNLKNFKINVVRPLKDNPLDPIQSHRLANFTEDGPRKPEDDPELMENLIKNKINTPVAKHAEAEAIHRALSFREDGSRIKTSKDPYNGQSKKLLALTDGIGHNVNDNSNYTVGEQEVVAPPQAPNKIVSLERPRLVPPQRQTVINDERNAFVGDFSNQERLDTMAEESQDTQDLLAQFSRDLGLDVPVETPQEKKTRLRQQAKEKFTQNLKDKLTPPTEAEAVELRTKPTTTGERAGRVSVRSKLLQEQITAKVAPPAETPKGSSGGLFPPERPPSQDPAKFNIDQKLKAATRVYEGYLRRMEREKNDPIESRKPAREKLSRTALEDAEREVMVLRNQRAAQRAEAKEPSFKDWVAEVRPDDVGADGKLSKNITKNSKVAEIWRKTGGKFTDDEKEHLNNNPTKEEDKYQFSLDDDEIADLASEDTKEARHQQVKDYEQKVHDGIQEVDNITSIEDGAGGKRTLTGEMTGGLSAVNLGIGIGAGYTTDRLLNKIDPDIDPTLKTGVSGAVSGGIGEAAALTLSGAGAGIAGSGGLLLAPAIAAGAAGNIAGEGAFKGIKKIGGTDFEATTGAGAAGGLAAGFTSGALLSAAAAGGVTGAAALAPADLETFGLASVGAGLLGAGIGATSYAGTQEFTALEKKIKSSTGATDLQADIGAGAGTGATIGGIAGTFVGGPVGTAVGAVVGGSVGGLAALAKYGIDKLF